VGSINIELAQLKVNQNERSRMNLNQQIAKPRFKNSFFNYLSVKKPVGSFKRSQSRMQVHFSKLIPFVTHLKEEETETKRFQNMGAGYRFYEL